jgi:hypothetical protein
MSNNRDIFIQVCPSEVHAPSGIRWKTLYNELCDKLCCRHQDESDSEFKNGQAYESKWTRGTAYDSLRRGGCE